MKHNVPLTAAGVALSLLLLMSCGTDPQATQAPAKDAVSASADTTTTSTSKDATKDAPPPVTNGQDSITVKGSGNGETSPIAFDQPYYIVKTTNGAAAEYGNVLVSVKGQELPAIMSMSAEYTTVFQPKATSVVFTIEASGSYTLQFSKPQALSSAVAAPQTFKGGAGTTVTPLVTTAGTYVKLTLKYTGTPDADGKTGAMLAAATIYDAETGDGVLNVPKYVNKAKTEDSDGNTRDKPGTYFLIVTGQSAQDTWEASITEK
ncbi:MAG: hypothetical protein ACOH16_06760 [Propionibacteriaceae bacterium]